MRAEPWRQRTKRELLPPHSWREVTIWSQDQFKICRWSGLPWCLGDFDPPLKNLQITQAHQKKSLNTINTHSDARNISGRRTKLKLWSRLPRRFLQIHRQKWRKGTRESCEAKINYASVRTWLENDERKQPVHNSVTMPWIMQKSGELWKQMGVSHPMQTGSYDFCSRHAWATAVSLRAPFADSAALPFPVKEVWCSPYNQTLDAIATANEDRFSQPAL